MTQRADGMIEKYSFCESVTAAAMSPWCVRLLTEKGRKLSGGIDTSSLCGRVGCNLGGWDIRPKVELDHPSICPRCKDILIADKRMT